MEAAAIFLKLVAEQFIEDRQSCTHTLFLWWLALANKFPEREPSSQRMGGGGQDITLDVQNREISVVPFLFVEQSVQDLFCDQFSIYQLAASQKKFTDPNFHSD